MNEIELLRPEALWGIFFIPLIIWLLIQSRKRGLQKYAVPFSSLALLSRKDRSITFINNTFLLQLTLIVIAYTLGLFGLADPASTDRVVSSQESVILLMDISNSMIATDLEPNRISVAREVAIDFVDSLEDSTAVGLIFFSGTSFAKNELTRNHSSVINNLRLLDESVLSPDTAIGEAIRSAVDMYEAASVADSFAGNIVIITDGSTTVGEAPDVVAEGISDRDIQIYPIGVGGDEEVVIEFAVDGEIEEAVLPPVNVEELTKVAEITGGEYFDATSEEELEAVLTSISEDSLTISQVDYDYLWPYFALASMLLFIGYGVVATRD